MKAALWLGVGLVLLSCLPVRATEENSDYGISSTKDVDALVVQLGGQDQQTQALTKLIKFAGIHLHEGSIRFSSNNPKRDDLCRYAAQALWAHHDQHLVLLALKCPDRVVRNWGIMSFEFTHGLTKPWEPYLPLLENLAVHDDDENIRAHAIERLRYYDKEQPFLKRLQKDCTEDSPDVLMRLYDFNSTNLETKNEFYLRAAYFLSSPEEPERLKWLNFIYFNVENPATAPMWRIQANDALVNKLKEMAASDAVKEREFAQKTLPLLKKS